MFDLGEVYTREIKLDGETYRVNALSMKQGQELDAIHKAPVQEINKKGKKPNPKVFDEAFHKTLEVIKEVMPKEVMDKLKYITYFKLHSLCIYLRYGDELEGSVELKKKLDMLQTQVNALEEAIRNLTKTS